MSKILSLISFILLINLSSCSNEEPVLKDSDINISKIDSLYKEYSIEVKNNFENSVCNLFSNISRSGELISNPSDLTTYLSNLTVAELDSLRSILLEKCQNIEEIQEVAYIAFLDSVGVEETVEYMDFCDKYYVSSNKLELLESSVQNKSQKLQNTYIATAATIDNLAIPITQPIVETNAVHIGGSGYYGECEHQFVRDCAKMCVDDVLIQFWGGGPEDIAADVTCGVGDLISVIHSMISYIDCKKNYK